MEESSENVDMLVCQTSWLRKFENLPTLQASYSVIQTRQDGFNESVRFTKGHTKIIKLAKSFLLQSSNEPLHLNH
jgi:hypothetical protein